MAGNPTLLAEIESDVLSDRPLADALRKCVVLGGQAGSVPLREWATKELRGYGAGENLPEYRTVPASIRIDAFTGNAIVTGQPISPSMLPEFVRDEVKERFTFSTGIGEIEAAIRQAQEGDRGLMMSLPMALDIARFMDHASDNPFQQITALYWSISSVHLCDIVDQVRTTLAELVAEMRAGMPQNQDVPSGELVTQAVNVAVHGHKSRVTVTSASASGSSSALVGPGPSADTPFWTRWRKIGAFLVGLATVAASVVAVLRWVA